jgi:hypothetical protein
MHMSGKSKIAKARAAREELVIAAAIQWLTWKRGELAGFPAAGYGPDGAFGLGDLEAATAELLAVMPKAGP